MNQGFSPQNDSSFAPNTVIATPVANLMAEARLNFIRKTYVLFMAGILMSIVAATVCLNVQPVYNVAASILNNPLMAILLIVGGSFAAQALARQEGLNYVALFGFTALIGFLFAPIVARYAPAAIGQAAFLTIATFGSLTAYAFITRKDFSFMGGILFVGMMTIVLAGAANLLFFKSWNATYFLAWATLFFSSGFVLYKTSNILHHYTERDACAAALGLFISFFNIFMSILRILSGNRN